MKHLVRQKGPARMAMRNIQISSNRAAWHNPQGSVISLERESAAGAFRCADREPIHIVRQGAVPGVNHLRAKRLFDVALALPLSILALPVVSLLVLLVRLTSSGPAIYWSLRVGRDNRNFLMPKLRSMRIGTPEIAAHLFADARQYLTPLGAFLRRTSLDELPQLFSILAGDMSVIGPRPALFNQDDLVRMRTAVRVHRLMPGLTGWAQVNGRGRLSLDEKVQFDAEYLDKQSFGLDLRILALTVGRVLEQEGIDR